MRIPLSPAARRRFSRPRRPSPSHSPSTSSVDRGTGEPNSPDSNVAPTRRRTANIPDDENRSAQGTLPPGEERVPRGGPQTSYGVPRRGLSADSCRLFDELRDEKSAGFCDKIGAFDNTSVGPAEGGNTSVVRDLPARYSLRSHSLLERIGYPSSTFEEREAAACILSNLVIGLRRDQAAVSWTRRKRDYVDLPLSYAGTMAAIERLMELGLVGMQLGSRAERRRTVLWALPPLAEILAGASINPIVDLPPAPPGLVVIRGLDGLPVRRKGAREIQRMERRIARYNRLMEPVTLSLSPGHGADDLTEALVGKLRFVRRVFNRGKLTCGGRLYGALHQSLRPSVRRHLLINGSGVVELDYRALHPSILYAER